MPQQGVVPLNAFDPRYERLDLALNSSRDLLSNTMDTLLITAAPPPAKSSAVQIDNRRHTRAVYHGSARLLVAPDLQYSCAIVDMSEGGIGVRMAVALPPETNCMVSFDLVEHGISRRVNAWGKIAYSTVHVQAVRAGVVFVDMDSYSKLLLRRVPTLSGIWHASAPRHAP